MREDHILDLTNEKRKVEGAVVRRRGRARILFSLIIGNLTSLEEGGK